MRVRHALGLSECVNSVAEGVAFAHGQGWAVTVAIVDDGGCLLHLSRMDEASPASIKGAIEKARSSALTGVETKVLEAMVKERPAIVTMGRVAVEGGLPIFHEGQRVGGIGVSGVQSHQDNDVARTVLSALHQAGPNLS